jgi:hypothetical protein
MVMRARITRSGTKIEAGEREEKRQQYQNQHSQSIQQLSLIVKIAGCIFTLLIGMLYVSITLLYADSQVAQMVMGLMGAFFFIFVIFVYAAFHRVVLAMGHWLSDLPMYQSAGAALQSDWGRALLIVPTLPLIFLTLVLSCVNQLVRKLRRIAHLSGIPQPEQTSGDSDQYQAEFVDIDGDKNVLRLENGVLHSHIYNPAGELKFKHSGYTELVVDSKDEDGTMLNWHGSRAKIPNGQEAKIKAISALFDKQDRVVQTLEPETLCLTARVSRQYWAARSWNWLSVCSKCYIICLVFACYILAPLFLNVILAWIIRELSSVSFGMVLLLVFGIGILAFLLPPVPGMTVYIFGGLLISDEKICPYGFAGGAIINIVLCWALKLAACAVQQTVIGGLLGRSTAIRSFIGVHKVFIRCIEAELQKPGLSIGKVAILCGGPDWPVSVLAGVLGLSLLQCELGTLPIVFFVAPCALTGSFYLKKGTNEFWTRLANMMIVISLVVNLILWALMAWAVQEQLEHNYHDLTKSLPQNVELEWLDYKVEEIRKRSVVVWADVPMMIRSFFVFGVFVQILCCQAFQFAHTRLFGNFQVNDDISIFADFKSIWYGTDDSLFSKCGMICVATYLGCWLFYIIMSCWQSCKTAKPRREAALELDRKEASWKEAWLKAANDQDGAPDETVEKSRDSKGSQSTEEEAGSVLEARDKQLKFEEEPSLKTTSEDLEASSPGLDGSQFEGNLSQHEDAEHYVGLDRPPSFHPPPILQDAKIGPTDQKSGFPCCWPDRCCNR